MKTAGKIALWGLSNNIFLSTGCEVSRANKVPWIIYLFITLRHIFSSLWIYEITFGIIHPPHL